MKLKQTMIIAKARLRRWLQLKRMMRKSLLRKSTISVRTRMRFPSIKVPVWRGMRPIGKPRIFQRFRILSRGRVLTAASLAALVIVLLISSVFDRNSIDGSVGYTLPVDSSEPVSTQEPSPVDKPSMKPVNFTVLDLSGEYIKVNTTMLQLNEPTPWGKEIIFSGGRSSTINEPVLTRLMVYNFETGEEEEIAETQVKFGEIYEGRMNDDWIVWLDTDQKGLNYIYGQDRKTQEVQQIKKCGYIRPQLRLFGDNLVWVEQVEQNEDRLYLYNFKSGEPIVIDSFSSSSYGTSPPSVYNNILTWAYPHAEDVNRSIIKYLDLEKALKLPVEGNYDIDIVIDFDSHSDDWVEPEIIDPGGFAIYPATNGKVIAWLDHLNPSKAGLKFTLIGESEIVEIAMGVSRIFGVGDTFIVYMQNDAIMLYFWDIKRYARLTAEGEFGRLSDTCVSKNVVTWYEADNPNQVKDQVRVSIVNQPLGD